MMTAIWIVVLALGLHVAWILWSIIGYPRSLFLVEHYREVALVLERLRTQAELHPVVEGDGLNWGEDPRTAITSRILAVAYTIRQEDGVYVHHLSVTTPPQGRITFAAGETFASFFAWSSV